MEEFEGKYTFPPEKSLEVFKEFFGTSNPFEAVFSPIPSGDVFIADYRDAYRVKQYPKVSVSLEDLYNGAKKSVLHEVKV